MRTYAYKVIFLNGCEHTVYCNGFTNAVILAMAHAIQMGWDMRIKYIVDENGVQIQDIQFPTFNFSK